MWKAFGKDTHGEESRVAFNRFLLRGGTFTLADATAYFLFLGYCAELITPAFLNLSQTTGSGTVVTAEVGFFSSPAPPNGTAQTLTKIVAGSFTATGTGKKRNSVFSTALAAPAYLWGGVRVEVSAGAVGTFNGAMGDWQSGMALFQSGSATFAAGSTFAASVFGFLDATTQLPWMFGSLD